MYFAPCLRSEKKGNAASAALLPALWIDIDGPEEHRQRDLERAASLSIRRPRSSSASGGGWHSYWLLDEPLLLNEENKQKIGRMMQGLFGALGGDEGYVKSVASVMRLPGSINTKPDRDSTAGADHRLASGSALPAGLLRLVGSSSATQKGRAHWRAWTWWRSMATHRCHRAPRAI